MIRIWESGNENNSISVPVLKNTAQNKASVIKVKDCDYGTKINSAAEYIYYVEKFTKKTEATEADKSNVKWAFWLNETQEKLSEKHFVIEATAEKQDSDTDFLLTSTNEDETLKKQENYNSIKDNGILSAVIEIADVEIGTETKQMPVLKVKFSKWLDGELIKVEAFSDEEKLTLSSNNDFVASREVKAATPQITEVYWTTKDGERIETTGYSEEIYMNMVSLGLKGQTIDAHILERDSNNPDNLSEEGDQIEWENNQFVIESRTFTRQFKVISKEQGETARQEDVDNGDTLFKMSFLQGLEDIEALELYLEVFNAADLGLDTTATYGNLNLSIENNIVDAYFAKVATENMALDAPLTDVLNSKKKKVGEKNTKGDVEQHEKLTEGVIGQKIKLVAECDNLDNDTEVVFQLFEKTPLLTAADTALKVVQEGKEVEEVIANVKDGYAVTEIELRPKVDADFKKWLTTLKIDGKPADRKKSYFWIKAKEKEGVVNAEFYKEEGIKMISTNWHEPVDNPQICLYTQNGNYRPRYNVFGNVRIERTKKPRHQGIDLLALPDTNIYACLDAEVVRAGDSGGGYGNVITLKVTNSQEIKNRKRAFTLQYSTEGEISQGSGFNEDGSFYIFYAHLSKVNVVVGQKVKAGKILGLNGTSGYGSSKDPHLHYEILNKSRAGSLNNRCHPGYYCYYKGVNDMTQIEKDYQKKVADKYWN